MAELDNTEPLIEDPRFAQPTGLNKRIIYGLLVALGLGVFVLAVYGMSRMMAPPAPAPVVVNEAPGMTTPTPPLPPVAKDVTTSFAGLDRRPQIPPATLVKETLPPLPVADKKAAEAPVATTTPPTTPPVEDKKPAASGAPTTKPRTKSWLFATTAQQGDKEEKERAQAQERGQSLITPASWVRSVDPTRMLYRGTVIHGIVLEQVVSDIPGDIKIHIDRPVLDGEGQGRTLIPQNAEAIVRQAGQVKYGDKRLGAELVQIRFRDGTGTLLQFKGAGADKSGAMGFTGKVDNKYPQLILGILGTVGLSIGAQAAGGNSNTYQPTLEQEMGRDVAQGANQAGQQILKRELQVNPTITVAAKEQVTLEVLENISLLTDPVIVKK